MTNDTIHDIDDVVFPDDIQSDVEDRARQILTQFFLAISKISEDHNATHMDQMMRVNSEVNGAKQGLTETVDTALSSVLPVN